MATGVNSNDLPEGYKLDEGPNGLPQGYELDGAAPVESHENFLQRAIRNSRIGPFGGTSITAAVPATGEEGFDLAKVIGRQIPGMRGGGVGPMTHGPIGVGLNLAGINQSPEVISPPSSQYGKNIETSADVAPFAALGLEGLTAGANGIHSLLSKGSLPQDIDGLKSSIQDIIKLGPQKIKGGIQDLFNQGQAEFGNELKGIKGSVTNNHIADALEKTANDVGMTDVQGSMGNYAKQLSNKYRSMISQNDLMGSGSTSFSPEEVQVHAKNIMDSFGSNMPLRVNFYKNLIGTLSENIPELSDLKGRYGVLFDTAEQAKSINSGSLGRVAKGTVGPEELGNMAQAQQMMGNEPNVVEQAMNQGDQLRSKQNQLEKIIGRQNFAKKAGWRVGAGLGLEELIRHLFQKKSSD